MLLLTFVHQKKLYTMKTKTKKNTEKTFDAVAFMREARDKISKETAGMDYEQLKNYFSKKTHLTR